MAAPVAKVMDNKAANVHSKAFDDEHYLKMTESHVERFKKCPVEF